MYVTPAEYITLTANPKVYNDELRLSIWDSKKFLIVNCFGNTNVT